MDLLDNIPGGTCLESPIYNRIKAKEGNQELRERILGDLFKSQREFCENSEHLILGFIGGFGSGKTRALCARALLLCMDNPGTVGAIFEPTFQLLKDVWVRSFDDFLEEYDIEHDFRVSPQPEYTIPTVLGSTVL